MGITTDGNLALLWDVDLDHSRLVVDNVLDVEDDLVDIFLVQLLSVLEPLDEIGNKLLRHVVAESDAVVVRLNNHGVDIEPHGRGFGLVNGDGVEEGHLTHNLFALVQPEEGVLVAGLEPDALQKVVDGILGLEDGCPSKTASVECLGVVRLS